MVRDGKRNKVKLDEFAARAGGARISGLVSSGRTLRRLTPQLSRLLVS
jgi:hypothetical protein